jgi:hypothetical protein
MSNSRIIESTSAIAVALLLSIGVAASTIAVSTPAKTQVSQIRADGDPTDIIWGG